MEAAKWELVPLTRANCMYYRNGKLAPLTRANWIYSNEELAPHCLTN